MRITQQFLLLIISCSLLASCGFQLRGHAKLPPELHTLRLTSSQPYSPLMQEIQRQLQARQITIIKPSERDAGPASQSYMTLSILEDNATENLSSVSADTQVRKYLLTYRMVYQLINSTGETLGPASTIIATRTYTAQLSQTLGSNQERYALENDLRRDVVQQLLMRLSSQYTKNLLAPSS